jgi:hypothetical protein
MELNRLVTVGASEGAGPEFPGELLTWEPPTWEYAEVSRQQYALDAQGWLDALNRLGADGWEFCAATGHNGNCYLFKRQRREEDAG